MARYIDADKVSEKLKRYLMPNVDIDGTVTVEVAERYLLELINKTPTADVVEVVRCEKCIHSEDYNGRILCNKNAHIFDKNDFCSYGTPKERGGEK